MRIIDINIDRNKQVTDIQCDGNEYEVKIYIKTKTDGSYEVRGTTLRTLMEHEKGIVTGLIIE